MQAVNLYNTTTLADSKILDSSKNSNNAKNSKNIELELRKKIPLDLFLEIYEANKSKPKSLKSSFSRSDSKLRDESFYDLGKRVSKETLLKEKLHTEVYEGFNLNVSRETTVVRELSGIKHARIKFRWSFDILPKWIMDLTLIIDLEPNKIVEMVTYYLVNQKRTDPKEILVFITDSLYYRQKPTILSADIEFEYFSKDKMEISDLTNIMEVIKTLSGVQVQNEKNSEITEKVSRVLYPKMQTFTNLKDMLYNPSTLDRRLFLSIKPELFEYTVAPKNDGERTLVVILKFGSVKTTNSENLDNSKKQIIVLNSTELIILGDQNPDIRPENVEYIIDSEMTTYFDESKAKSDESKLKVENKKILAFDLLYHKGNLIDTPQSDYLDRFATLQKIEKEIVELFKFYNPLNKQTNKQTDKNSENPNSQKNINFGLNNVQKFSDLSEKEFYDLANNKDNKNNKKTDGLIFTHFTDPERVYKWKPLEHNTIDFLIIAAPAELLGKYGYEKTDKQAYILCSGINPEDRKILGLDKHLFKFTDFDNSSISGNYRNNGNNYNNLQFVPFMSSLDKFSYIWYSERKDLDMKIGEFHLSGFSDNLESSKSSKSSEKTRNPKKWELVRERPDRDRLVKLGRYYGNYYKIAEMNYLYYFNPVELSQFYEKETNYFRLTKKDEYKTMIGFNNFVKENVLAQVRNTFYLVDLSSGKGQDIFRYNSFGVKNLLAVDKDGDAISELVSRKYSLGNPNFYKYNRNQILKQTDFTFIQARICDLSQDTDIILEVLKQEIKAKYVTMNLAIHYLLEDKSTLIRFSKLIDRLLENGGTFIFSTFCGEKLEVDFEQLKKSGKPEKIEFDDTKFNISRVPGTRKIEVLHPFSEEVYRENMVNISEVVKQFESLGFSLRQQVFFSEFLQKYPDSDKLTESEKKYVDYYVYVSLFKN